MKSKERIQQTLKHKESDRVPLHMNATNWVIDKLHQRLGTTNDCEIMAALNLDTYDMRGLDIRAGIMPKYKGPDHPLLNIHWSGDMLRIWGIEERIMSGQGWNSFALDRSPLSDAKNIKEIRSYQWPDPGWFTYDHLEQSLAE